MRSGKILSALTATLSILLISTFPAQPPAWSALNNDNASRIFWAFGAIRAASIHPKAVPVTSGMVLCSGDKLKMMIRTRARCFVYLIYKDSRENFTMLFPYSPGQFDSDYRIDRNYYVPEGDAWFQLDKRTGRETFYLIASDQRLLDIEYTYEKYASSKEARNKQALAGQMISELQSITREYFASSCRADLHAGHESLVRGFERAAGADPTDITGLAREISFNNIYTRTFVIEHK